MFKFSQVMMFGVLVAICGSTAVAADCGKSAQCESKSSDIVDTAVAAGDFNTLAAALKAAGLVETLKGDGPFTVFAPTDKAFNKLPEGTVEELLKPENKAKLTAILTYHVVPGKVLAEDVVKLSEAKTVQGAKVKIAVKNDKVKVNNAKVVATDIQCSNGVIHVINRVILPPQDAVSRAKAVEMIETAVHRGSHLYNTGHAASFADLYVTTAKQLVAMSPSPMPEEMHEHLRRVADRSGHIECDKSRAWTMRFALDRAYASLDQ